MIVKKILIPFQIVTLAILLIYGLMSCSKVNDSAEANVKKTYLALGDSYTIGESVKQKNTWPYLLCDKLKDNKIDIYPTKVIAKTGWRTDQMLASAKEKVGEDKFDLVSLLIGVNNEFQGESTDQFTSQFKTCLEYAIAHCNKGKENVFVVSIPDYGFTPYGENNQAAISERIEQYNAICKATCESYGVKYFNITPISRNGLTDKDLVANDGLHPSDNQYDLWVQSFYEQVLTMIAN